MKLTEHFSFDELTKSSSRPDLEPLNRRKAVSYMDNIQLVANQLEVLRHSIGDLPITVYSGFRCEELNKAVGGAKRSGHLSGLAADIVANGLSVKELFEHIKSNPIPHIAKVIHEKIGSHWVHISFSQEEVKTTEYLVTVDGRNYERVY